jgi:sugar/nucleoside kinase (ribokinase family)
VDRLYRNVSFSDPDFLPYLSKKRGDGGLTPGKLVFREEFEEFCGEDLSKVLKSITKGKEPDKKNIGGPGIVPLIHAKQMMQSLGTKCLFYGCGGKDPDGEFIFSILNEMNLLTDNHYYLSGDTTPSTIVLSDPDYDKGHGERIFINSIGEAWNFSPDKLDEEFFSSDVVVFGGTALVPVIHDNLTELLIKAKSNDCLTIVNTVYDFRNEKASPEKKWPLGRSDDSYTNTDLLITDLEEALRLSGKNSLEEAIHYFRDVGTGALLVTNGPNNLRGFASGKSRFLEMRNIDMPVSEAISQELKKGHAGDTTGCGDNFTGGVIADLVSQIQKGKDILDLAEASAWGIVSGGYSCFYMGGTFFENNPGEKLNLITPYYKKYIEQIR